MDSIRKTKSKIPLVSVVVTTRNEEKNIENCLQSIRAQTWTAIESIVIDNDSVDRTLEISKKLADKTGIKGPERSAQRNYGMMDLASGDYVIYLDADMILSPVAVEACIAYIQQTGAIALHVPEIVLGNNYFSRVRRFERGFYDGTPIDGARFFDRQVFVRAGGFDQELFKEGSGEDWDIDKKIKRAGSIQQLPHYSDALTSNDWILRSFVDSRGVIHKDSYSGIYHNESEFLLIDYLKKKLYYSIGFENYIKKWGKQDIDIKKQFGFYYRYIGVFVENKKWIKLFSRPDLMMGMYFLRALVGFIYIYMKIFGRRK